MKHLIHGTASLLKLRNLLATAFTQTIDGLGNIHSLSMPVGANQYFLICYQTDSETIPIEETFGDYTQALMETMNDTQECVVFVDASPILPCLETWFKTEVSWGKKHFFLEDSDFYLEE